MTKNDKNYTELKKEYDKAKQDLKNSLHELITTTPILEYLLLLLLIIYLITYITLLT
jgi:hypothetical protein